MILLREYIRSVLLEQQEPIGDRSIDLKSETVTLLASDSNFKSLNSDMKDAIISVVVFKQEIKQSLGLSDRIFKIIVIASIGIIGRESSFGRSKSYYATDALETGMSIFINATSDFFEKLNKDDPFKSVTRQLPGEERSAEDIDTSIGPGQIVYSRHFKPGSPLYNWAVKIGIGAPLDVRNYTKALLGTMGILARLYSLTRSRLGYSENVPGVNTSIANFQSTGNAVLDMSLVSYTVGEGTALSRYCGKGRIKKKCSGRGAAKYVHNYIPNYSHEEKLLRVIDRGKLTTIGYVEEVSATMKGFGWLAAHL